MSTIPTRITDKNGKNTTVHRKQTSLLKGTSRLAGVVAPPPVSRFSRPSDEQLAAMEKDRVKREAAMHRLDQERDARRVTLVVDHDDNYRGFHSAPGRDNDGYPMTETEDAFPNLLDGNGLRLYSDPSATRVENQAVIDIVRAARANPNMEVTVYRSMPQDAEGGINPNDWVTPILSYAETHARSNISGAYKIAELKVKVSDLFTEANSLVEWGYSPE